MGKIKDYFKKHKKNLEDKILIGGAVLFAAVAVGLHNACKTRIKSAGTIFVVSNYDIGRGYVFVYEAKESGWENLVEDREEYIIFVNTDSDNKFKPRTYIRFEDLGKNHPLNDRYMYPESVESVEIGEEILNKTREKYKEYIPFQKILDKIKD